MKLFYCLLVMVIAGLSSEVSGQEYPTNRIDLIQPDYMDIITQEEGGELYSYIYYNYANVPNGLTIRLTRTVKLSKPMQPMAFEEKLPSWPKYDFARNIIIYKVSHTALQTSERFFRIEYVIP